MAEKGIAVLTGASSGIGRAISERLLRMGYEVYGIGRNFKSTEAGQKAEGAAAEQNPDFHALVCDLLDTERLLSMLEPIRKTGRVKLLVNNAGVAYYGLHEELDSRKIQRICRTNLEVPLLLSQFFLRELKKNQGCIVNISSVTATHASPHAAAYGASKAGLLSFSRSLFEEGRKYGLRVLTILPDMTATELYRNADFAPGESPEVRLEPEEVAEAVEYALSRRAGINISEILLRPQKNQIVRRTRK